MDRASAKSRQCGWAAVLVLAPTICLAQQNPGLSAQPTGRLLGSTNASPGQGSQSPAVGGGFEARHGADDTQADPFAGPAAAGVAWAQTRLALNYLAGAGDPVKNAEAVRLLTSAADANDPEALYQLGLLSLQGRGLPQSEQTGFSYIRRAADMGWADAQFALANMLAKGTGEPRDEDTALDWARKAAKQEHLEAMNWVAVTLLRRASNEKEVAEGLELLVGAAERNHRRSQMALAGILTRGEFGLAKDQKRAEELLLPRANEGDAEFQFGLATLYLYGDQFSGSKETGMAWLRKSAEAGYERSQDLLKTISTDSKASSE